MANPFRMRTRCDGVSRREMLRVGGLTGLGFWAFDWFRLRALAGGAGQGRAKSCILLWLDGGPSHLETFDLKPDAPSEVRGPFKPIATNVPGIQICELMPHTARVTDKLSIIRSMTSPLGEHGLANHYLLTGYKPSPALEYPSYGAVVAHQRNGQHTLPSYVAIPEYKSTAGAGYLGSAWQPFATGGDPAKPDFHVRDLDFYPEVTASRMERRREYLSQLERFEQRVEGTPPSDPQFEQAYRLVTSPEAKAAFDLTQEAEAVRARYGPRTFGQSCLLARRLVERGVPFITVQNTGWDTHENLVLNLKEGYAGAQVGVGLIPTFDQAFAALVGDLSERGLLDETLVIAMGEFGRTPKLNPAGGRDHWPRAFSVVLAGGGVPGGQVIGASDRVGESPADRPVTPNDLARTIYTVLGVDPDRELHTADGRPVRVNQGGEVIRELVG
ncbi:MAG: DUF1501 domain-containing protein [Pirellulales bacterium]